MPEGEPSPDQAEALNRFGPTAEDLAALKSDAPRFMKRFMDGKATPQEVWRRVVLRNRTCFGCGSPRGAILIRVFMPLKEAYERNPELLAELAKWAIMQGVQALPTVQFGVPPEDFIRVSEKVACDNCKATAERAAAHGPSWCVVEIQRGPKNISPVIQAARLTPRG